MKRVRIEYNPYAMKTVIIGEGQNLKLSKHCDSHLKNFLNTDMPIPIQSWIDPVERDEWIGLLAALCQMGDYNLEISFYGRDIDYEDLKKSLLAQNDESYKMMKKKANLVFVHNEKKIVSDYEMKKNIDDVVATMLTPEFAKIVEESESPVLQKKYNNLQSIYNEINEKEFRIIFTGTYSSGKSSTINAVIGKNILPTASGTCTSRVCKIINNGTSNKYAQVVYYADDKKQICDCDTAEEVQEKIKNVGNEVENIEVYTDLSNLYPEGNYQDFNIVIIDTPGTDSASGNDDASPGDGKMHVNKPHIEITKKVLMSKDKEIIILVSDDKLEDENIVELLDLIEESMNDDEGAFNDRFLFAMNMCDELKYTNDDESLPISVCNFISNIKRVPNSPRSRSILNPRIYPVTSGSALAVKCGYTKKPDISERKTKKWELFSYFKKFCESIYFSSPDEIPVEVDEKEIADSNYCLEQQSSISQYDKLNFEKKLSGNIPVEERILIHSGIPSLESAIREYISHYAYPIKVRELLRSFEDILAEINTLNDKKIEALKEAKKDYSDAASQKEAKIQKVEKEKERKKVLEEVDKAIITVKQKINGISETVPQIDKIRAKLPTMMNGIAVKIGERPEIEEYEANEIISDIASQINTLVEEIKIIVKDVKAAKKQTTKVLYNEFLIYIEKLEQEGLLNDGRFNLKETVEYRKIVDTETFVRPEVYSRDVANNNKEHIEFGYGIGNFFSSVGRAWKTRKEQNTIKKKFVDMSTYFDENINPIQVEVDKYVEELKNAYKADVKDLKDNTAEKVEKIRSLLDAKKIQVENIKKEVTAWAQDEETYGKKIIELTEIGEYLSRLTEKISYTQIL